ncbi:MAG: hypothetical protein KDI31_06985 [Pseudomonadales bacterium]|nr:hypothetical protein [Pseudomonadales bacterium]
MPQLQELLTRGQRIWVAGNVNEPTTLLDQLTALPLPEQLTFIQFPLAGYNSVDFTRLSSTCRMETFFMSPALRRADPARLDFVPMQMRAVFDYLRQRVDVAMVQLARDRQGRLRLGPGTDFSGAALAAAKIRIGELNHSFTAPAGAPLVDADGFDLIVESERPLYEMQQPAMDDAALAIGAQVAGLIRDGDCLQTGIGSIPAAILAALGDHSDLGLHGGIIDDGGMALIRAGNVNGMRKQIDCGLHITGMALGGRELIDWLADTPEVAFRGADHTHEISTIRKLDRFVSINSAVEVDLFGQVNAEYAGGRQISGTGGSVDFMRAARASRGGRSIVAMNATARDGSISRIVPKVELVTALRTDVDLVVTEYGVAKLDGRSVAARAEALISIAAPGFRDGLRDRMPG